MWFFKRAQFYLQNICIYLFYKVFNFGLIFLATIGGNTDVYK